MTAPPGPPRSVASLVAERYAHRPTASFVEDARGRRVLTYADLQRGLAAWSQRLPLAGRVILDVEDPVCFAATYLALLGTGQAVVPIDPAAPDADVARTVRATGAQVVVSDRPERWRRSALAVHDAELRAGDEDTVIDRAGSVLLPTSGSTGDPKLIELDQARLLHVGRAVAGQLELSATDRGYNPLPLFHINAQVVGLLATLVSGGTLVLDRRFHRTGFWDLTRARSISWINAVPAILTILARDELPDRIEGLRFIRSASAPLPVAVRAGLEQKLGLRVIESYGMTEAASQITSTGLREHAPAGSVGRPVRAELQVRDEAGRPAPPNVIGRVWIRGDGVITGYADGRGTMTFDAAGWLDTGDLGYLDVEGNLYMAGRADDVINRGGELVYPREIEEILLEDPRVIEAVVVAAPHDVLGQVPVAQLVHRPGLSAAEVEQLVTDLGLRCADELSRFKRPAAFAVVENFPRASVGKIRRHLVREAAALR